MIKRLVINKLFGIFDYDIDFGDENVTILTGPNGYGKSTILRIINALSNGNVLYFSNLDFNNIECIFEDDKLEIKKTKTGIKFGNASFTYKSGFPFVDDSRFLQLDKDVWRDRYTGRIIEREDLSEWELFDEGYYEKNIYDSKTLMKEIEKVKNNCGSVRFISEQRLIKKDISSRREKVVDVISNLPGMLKNEISMASVSYSAVSNKLDGSYPKRLFNEKAGLRSADEFSNCLEEANKKFQKLNQYKLVDIEIIDNVNYNDKYATALKIYFDDFEKKYEVFEELIKKLDLFTEIINQRLQFKYVQISREYGFQIVNSQGTLLNLHDLSSGEKQEIVLFYDLIFNTTSNLLLLIDEPEISLHVSWQMEFLNDLLKITEKGFIKAIVATHSPQIINNHWNIQVDLGALYAERV